MKRVHKAKRGALERGAPLSDLPSQDLHDPVETEDEYERARARRLTILSDPPDLGSHGERTWTRDELHER